MLMLTLALILAPAPSAADKPILALLSGHGLLAWCEKDKPGVMAGGCVGFIVGVVQTVSAYEPARPNRDVCLRDETTYTEHVHLAISFLREHPERLGEPSFRLVRDSLKVAFPCPAVR